jgi:hypothetical protein
MEKEPPKTQPEMITCTSRITLPDFDINKPENLYKKPIDGV